MSDNGGYGAGTVWLAFLAGAVVGAVAAVLLAPGSGPETRERLRAAARDAMDEAMRRVNAARDERSAAR